MKFQKPEEVLRVIRAGQDVETVRSANRTKVLDAANFKPPFSAADVEKLQIKTNVNFGELAVTLSHARGQLLSAFLSNRQFFTVKIPLAPSEYRSDWEAKITEEINRPLRDSPEYFELHRNRWNSVVLHGVGPMTWRHSEKWLPQFVALDDLRIPTDTTLDFKNLPWYAHRIPYTVLELVGEVFNEKKNNHWDKKAVTEILKNYKDIEVTDPQNSYTWDQPEKMADLVKQSGGLYGSDAVPTIPLFHFYFQDEDEDGELKWYMRVVADSTAVKGSNGTSDEFLWQSKKPIADSWRHLLHCQFGDLSADTPYKFHAVRGLGFALLEPSFFSNLLRCRYLDAANDTLNMWIRVLDSAEKARSSVQDFGNNKVISKSVEIVKAADRHQPNQQLVESCIAQMKQLQQEASTSYTQQTDTGTNKEQTAFETRVKLEQVNAMMSGILLVAFTYEKYADIEICRRFCIPDSTDKDVRTFRKKMLRAGIPKAFLDIDLWEVEPVTPLGQGNPTMALSIAQDLYAIKGDLPPEAQNKVLHDYVLTITKDPARANDLVPLKQRDPSDAAQSAADRFGSLMQGVQLPLRNKNLIDQIDIMLQLLDQKVQHIEQRDNAATVDEAVGLGAVLDYINQAIQKLSQDPQQKARVKNYSDAFGKIMNRIKGVAQRGQEAAKAKAQKEADGENQAELAMMQAKIQADAVAAQQKLQQQQLKDAQAMTQKQIAFESEEQRKNELLRAEMDRMNREALADIKRKNVALQAEVEADRAKTAADIENSRKIATAKAKEPKPKPAGADK